ncbi:MAG TPA: N-acetylglucosamine-6-phosphate deacetylase [Chitinophagaceae bacterium]|nr:N-acetylglucosamine-6-phosphate deacetylase [Chitinophagaceae bacterium]
MPDTKIYKADKIFTGDKWLQDHAVITRSGIVHEIIPVSSLGKSISAISFPGCFIAPAFIDLQIYGAYKKLFAVYPEADSLYKLKEYCNKGGAAYCLATVATNTNDVFYKCIDAIQAYWNEGGEGILGLHIEGPWINPVKRGAHIESLIHPPAIKEVEELLTYGKGVIKMITLAPEICSKEVIDHIRAHNIIISAGHSNAKYKEALQGFSNGIKTVTHLYNAMSGLQHREPGLVGATFEDENVMASIIPDGHHVDYAAIRIAKKIMGERLFAITDAVTETNEGFYQHYLAGDKYESVGILSGSALNMGKALQNLVNHVNIALDEGLRMCSLYPLKVLGIENELGKIEKGFKANMVVLNDDLDVVSMI